MAQPLWTLYNNKTEQSHEGLTPEQAQEFVRAQSASELEFWFVWFEGLSAWEPVTTRSEFAAVVTAEVEDEPAIHIFWMADSPEDDPLPTNLDQISENYQAGQPTSGKLPRYGQAETDLADYAVTMPEGAVDGAKTGAERREFERFDIRYRVIVRNENMTFRTFSKNISLGGIALEMAVPETMLGSDCQIYVGNPKTGENIRFAGKLVPNRSSAKYFLFLKSSAESRQKLQEWVKSHSVQKKKSA